MSLQASVAAWETMSASPTVIGWIRHGAQIPFRSPPPPSHLTNRGTTIEQEIFIEQEIGKLIQAGTIIETEEAHNVSPIGAVPKKNGKWRLIVDMRRVNSFIDAPKFSMEDIRKLRPLLQKGDWMTSLDLKDGFHHVPVHPQHQRHLGMRWKDKTYIWTHLPFGLSASPYIFSKTLRETIKIIRKKGIRINCYMDDLLIMAESKEECKRATEEVQQTLIDMGWQINIQKSQLTPSQTAEYLGFTIDTKDTPRLQLQKNKMTVIRKETRRIISQTENGGTITARRLARFLGILIANSAAVEPTQIMTRSLFACLRGKQSWESLIQLDEDARKELTWWHQSIKTWSSTALELKTPSIVMATDASKTGWGATLEGCRSAQGFFPPEIQIRSSNYRELWAIYLAICDFKKELTDQSILLRTDNTTSMYYINGQGGPHKPLNAITKLIFWALKEINASITVLHIPGKENHAPDALSRLNPITEWKISSDIFRELDTTWGPYTIDRFSTARNRTTKRYNSRFHEPEAEATDALLQDWSRDNNWINPPFRMIPQIVRKLRTARAAATLIAPIWPSSPWFPALLKIASDVRIFPAHSLTDEEGAEPRKNQSWTMGAFKIFGNDTLKTGTRRRGRCYNPT